MKIKFSMNTICPLSTEVKQSVRSALLLHEKLQALFIYFIEQAEQANEIALACTIGPNQYIQSTQLKVF